MMMLLMILLVTMLVMMSLLVTANEAYEHEHTMLIDNLLP